MENDILDYNFYFQIKKILDEDRNRAYKAVNFAMVEAYWKIGKSIVEIQNGNKTAGYGANLLSLLSKKLTSEYGKGFTTTNLKYMRKFYLCFQNRHTLSD